MTSGVAEEEAFVRCCLEQIWDGKVQAVALTDLSPRICRLGDQRLRQLLANVVQPRFSTLPSKRPNEALQPQASIASWCMDQWKLFHTAAAVLADLTSSEPWGGKLLGAAITAASARVLVATLGADALQILREKQLALVTRYRSDPDSLDMDLLRDMKMTISLMAELASQDMRQQYIEDLSSQCQDVAQANAKAATQSLSLGGPPDGWVARLSHCCAIEAALDGMHSGAAWKQAFPTSKRLASISVAEWIRQSLHILPWLLAWILAPHVIQKLIIDDSSGVQCSDLQLLQTLRDVLEHSNDPDMLRRLHDAFLSALTLLLQLSRVEPCMGAESFVDWCVAVLTVAHSGSKLVLRGLPSATIASALASRIADFCVTSAGEYAHPPLPPPMLEGGETHGNGSIQNHASGLDVKNLASKVRQELKKMCKTVDDPGPPPLERIADALAARIHAEVRTCIAGEVSHGLDEFGGWSKQLSAMLLFFHLLPDVSAAPLFAQCRLAALRALGSAPDNDKSGRGAIEKRLLSFFRQECGHSNPTLRHLTEVCRDASGRGVLIDGKCNAVVCSSLAVSNLGLSALTEDVSLPAAVPDLFKASASLMATRGWWTGQSVKAHRRLSWRPLLSCATIVWHHSSGDVEISCSELQAHLLLAFARRRQIPATDIYAAAQVWENREADNVVQHWKAALNALCQSDGPLQMGNDGIVEVKLQAPTSKHIFYDLAVLLRPVNGWASSSTSDLCPDGITGGREASARAPLVDAAVMRLLKRWHILTVKELLTKMANFPVSLELPRAGESANPGVFEAVQKAAASELEVHSRALALADRGYLEVQVDGKKIELAACGAEATPPEPGTCYVYTE